MRGRFRSRLNWSPSTLISSGSAGSWHLNLMATLLCRHQGHLIDFATFGGVRDDHRRSLVDNMQFTRPDAVPMKIEGRFWSAPAGNNAVAVTTDGLCLGELEMPKARASITSLAPAQA